MGAAAELHGDIAHLHHADHLAVLLAEGGDGALLLGLLNGQDLGDDGIALQDGLVDEAADLSELVGGDGLKVGEVEAQAVGLHQRAGLVDMVAQDLLQGGIQQMGGAVGPHDGLAALHIHGGEDFLPHPEAAALHGAGVHELAALVLLNVGDGELRAGGGADHAVVGHLAAHLGVEGALIQDDHALHPGDDLVPELALSGESHDVGGVILQMVGIIAVELGGGDLLAELDAGPAQVAQGLAGLSRPLLLLPHELLEALLVHAEALIPGHLDGEVDGEAEGIVELEGVGAGEGGLALGLVLGQHLGEDLHAAVDGLGEALLLGADDLGDIGGLLPHVLVLALVDLDHGLHDLIEEGTVHAQELAVTGGPAQQAAQDVAPALVAGQDAVADEEAGGPDMVRDDAQGHIVLVALAVVGAGDLADLVGDVHDGIHIEEGVHVLHHAGQALQAHAGIDVLLLELGVVVVTVVIELGKDVVPDLDIAVAVAAHGAAGLAAAVLGAAVIVDLGAGAAGTGAVLPEVILLAEAEDAVLRDADLLVPDVEGLVIVLIDGGIEAVLLQAHHLGQELPGPGDGFLLEVITEGEVAQHLEEGAVAVGVADVVDVAGADALLAGADPVTGGLLLALEPGLHGSHTGVDEEQGLVVLGDQGEAGQTQVAVLLLKVAEEHLPQLVEAVVRMGHGGYSPLFVKFLCCW